MNNAIKNAIQKALSKYGTAEHLCSIENLKGEWEQHIATDSVQSTITSDLNLRHKLINQGRILEENTDEHYYYWLLQLKGLFAPEALAVTIRDGTTVHIGIYVNDGLRSQKRALQGIEQMRTALLQ